MEILSLGEKIKRRRKELGMTLKDLAGERITPGQISLVESGKSNPSMDLLEYLANKLSTSVEYIMESEETQAEKICLFYENVAETYIISNDLVQAQHNIESALYYAEKYKLENRKANILYLRATIHMLKGEEILAQQLFLSANVIFIKNNCYEEVVKTFIKLGKITLDLKAYHSASSYFQQAEKVFVDNSIANDFLIGEIYYFTAMTFLKLENITRAINYTYLAKEKFAQINDKERYAKSMMLLAEEYSKQGHLEEAIKYSKKSLELFKDINNVNYLAQIENNMGRLFSEFENIEESFIHLNKAREIRRLNGDRKLIETLINICENHIKLKNVSSGKEVLKDIYSYIEKHPGDELESNIDLMNYYLLKHKIDRMEDELVEAENSLFQALNIAKENDIKKKIGEISILLGKFYVETGNESKASVYLIGGVQVFKDLGLIKDF
ncbi:helix-turn-helix domain-containing protein [Haloimpatiens lingqiaonensis]|uniref:helix-turn-helix domain-containing protein n=1 Tax=Haloimpatiens lingqiaonensis TaxID=1380675 RepID=UPI0010FD0D16|nr:helix-turn-helix domain-containing protein [Haloimpatiens lingqiaonensis]